MSAATTDQVVVVSGGSGEVEQLLAVLASDRVDDGIAYQVVQDAVRRGEADVVPAGAYLLVQGLGAAEPAGGGGERSQHCTALRGVAWGARAAGPAPPLRFPSCVAGVGFVRGMNVVGGHRLSSHEIGAHEEVGDLCAIEVAGDGMGGWMAVAVRVVTVRATA
nr:hypothetical protein [Candidatus Protofrankia datiscae]